MGWLKRLRPDRRRTGMPTVIRRPAATVEEAFARDREAIRGHMYAAAAKIDGPPDEIAAALAYLDTEVDRVYGALNEVVKATKSPGAAL